MSRQLDLIRRRLFFLPHLAKVQFDEELLLLGEDGAPFLESNKNKAYVIRGKSWVNNHAHVLRAVSGVTSNSYVCHYLNLFDFHEYVTGTTRLKLNQSQMNKIPIPLAPLPEQHRIVAKIEEQFTRLDAGVAALKRAQANLKRYKAAVLKAACEGRLVAQDPGDEPASELLKRILAERRAKWAADLRAKGKDPQKAKYEEPQAPDIDALPELPNGWCWTTIDAAFHVNYGLSESLSKTEPDNELDVPVIRIPNITEFGGLDLSELKYFPLDNKTKQKLLLHKGDVLFNWRNAPKWIGRTTAFEQDGEFVNASFLLKLRPHLLGYSRFVAIYLNYLRLKGYFMSIVNNAVNQANFNEGRTSQDWLRFKPDEGRLKA